MSEGIESLGEFFPGREIPPGLERLLAPIRLSREEFLQAVPSRLAPPSSLPGFDEQLGRLEEVFSAGRPLVLLPGDSPDATAAASLLLRGFRPQRRKILVPDPGNGPEGPRLELDGREGIALRDGDRTDTLPFDAPGGDRYSAAGLAFKLGEGRMLAGEAGFGRESVAFDLETTGTDYRRDQIIEIGAVRVSGGEIGEEFSALVKPSRPLSRTISKLTGITDADLAGAPPLEEVLPKFLDFIGDSVLVAHNVEFDHTFIKRDARRILGKKLENETYCTLLTSRARMPGQSHRLGAVAEALNIELKDWHRATADARAAALIYLRFREEDVAPKRFGYFQAAVGRACLGTLLAGAPIRGDNAVFFRQGFEGLLADYAAGERYFRKRAGRAEKFAGRVIPDLDSRWRKKRGRAVYLLVRRAAPPASADDRP